MQDDDFEIRMVDSWPVDEVAHIYRTAGWWKEHYRPEGLTSLMKGSFAFVIAIQKSTGKAVGMGRAISDGVSDAWIQDVAVLEEFRNQGLGREITRMLLEHCKAEGMVWIGLVAEPGTRAFYEPLGFRQLPGEPMVFQPGAGD